MRYFKVIVVVLALGLSGCLGSRQPLNPPQLVGATDSDMSIQLFMQATIMMAKYYGFATIGYAELQERAARHGLNAIPFMPPTTVRATPKLVNLGFDIDDPDSTSKFRTWVKDGLGYNNLVRYYILTGSKAAQLLCRNHLLGLDERNRFFEFLQQEFKVAYVLSTGILAAVNANGSLLNAFAIGRTGVDSGIDAYQDYRFLQIVDRDSARILVNAAQEQLTNYFLAKVAKAEANSKDGLKLVIPEQRFTFAEALDAVNAIEFQCTRGAVQNLVNKAVSNTPTNLWIDPNTGAILFKSNINAALDTERQAPAVPKPVNPQPGVTTPPPGQTK